MRSISMRHISILITLFTIVAFNSCNGQFENSDPPVERSPSSDLTNPRPADLTSSKSVATEKHHELQKVDAPVFKFPQNRMVILNNLKVKIAKGEHLTVHVFVPLCDNENQGIVPTSPSIGNGFDAKRNLYWGTSKGMKRYFSDLSDWELVHGQEKVNELILDRAIFEKKYSNGTKVLLIMDAYRGDQMQLCLEDYFKSLAGEKLDTITTELQTFPAYGNADLLIFNGHNGLMDESASYFKNADSRPKDAVAIACISKDYFKPYWELAGAYPLVMTSGLMYPGAFCTEFIVNEWALLNDAEACRKAAGSAYYKYKPKSGPNGSNNLFRTGW